MRNLRSLAPYLGRYRWTYVTGITLLVVSNVLTTLGPRFLEQAIDAIEARSPMAVVVRSLGFLVGVAVLGGAARFGMRQALNSGSRRVETDLRDDLFAHLVRQDPAFFARFPTGDLMSRATNDLTGLRMVAGPALMYLVDTAVRAALVIPAMLRISPALTGLALLPMVGLPVVMVWLGRRIHTRALAIQEFFGTLTTDVHEHLSGVRVVRAYRQEAAEAAHFRELNDEYLDRNLRLAYVQSAFHPLLAILGGLGGVIVLLVGGRLVLAGTVTAGAFVAFGVYLMMLVWPLVALGWAISLVQRGSAAMTRVAALFDHEPAVRSPAIPVTLPPVRGGRAVSFNDVWFRYPGQDRGWALQGISFTVDAGRSLAIVGATGSGKSTLVELLTRGYDPDRGTVALDGVDLRHLDLGVLRRAVGVVPQETFLFSDTLRHNVLLGSPDDSRLERAADVSQLAAALSELPNGMDTMLGERGINLSGGQKQRAAIARALVLDAPVFVLDDALSAVDAQTEARILRALRGALARGTTIILSHRLAAVRDADEILVLDGGRIVERGTHATLFAARGRYWELLNRQEIEASLEVSA